MGSIESGVAARARTRLGTVLRGKYRLDRVLGIGGMAVVYAATHRNQKQFAVKMLHPELSMHADVCGRFLREGYVANSVKHPGAVAVLDDDVADDGSAFLVMELLEGEGVDHVLQKANGRLSPRAALAVGHQLLEVLAAAHDRKIVHRDIKPANLFLTRDGGLKVLDFGIARLRDTAAGDGHATNTGMILGTPAFMAPEQALAKSSEVDGQTDIWAAGATLFTLLTGEAVHVAENASQILVKAATERARPLAAVVRGIDARIAHVVDRSLAFEKGGRWPSAAAMRDAIRDAHRDAFGEPVSRAALVPLLPSVEAVFAATQPEPLPGTLIEARPTPQARGRPGGVTTAQPVSNKADPSLEPKASRSSMARGLLALAAVVALLAAGVVALTHGRGRGASLTGAGSDSAAPIAATQPMRIPAPTPVEAPPPPAPASPRSALLAAPITVAPVAPTVSEKHPPANSHRGSVLGPAGATPRPSASAAIPAPNVTPKQAPNCDPPYTIDAQGIQHPKLECL